MRAIRKQQEATAKANAAHIPYSPVACGIERVGGVWGYSMIPNITQQMRSAYYFGQKDGYDKGRRQGHRAGYSQGRSFA